MRRGEKKGLGVEKKEVESLKIKDRVQIPMQKVHRSIQDHLILSSRKESGPPPLISGGGQNQSSLSLGEGHRGAHLFL